VLAQIIGASPAHARMLQQLQRIVASEAPALLEGDTGSGKELAARAIHYGGPRAAQPFVPVNCGALPETLIEAELFGHERGAFTDARRARAGLVAEARGGTLFLDEVDALSPRAQVTLLRFLQDQRYRPLGTARELATDVRLIAAANRPLDLLVARDAFRADLMYRLKILHLVLPPLAERGGDVELLAEHFIARYALQYGLPAKTLHPATRLWMRRHPWPGNVRELENWVHREFLMASGSEIVHGEGAAPASAGAGGSGLVRFQLAKTEALRNFERDYLRRALHCAGGNVTRAAQLAGKERRAFGKLLKKHGIGRGADPGAPAP
jgi:DNA-binding NtrC family response regulator